MCTALGQLPLLDECIIEPMMVIGDWQAWSNCCLVVCWMGEGSQRNYRAEDCAKGQEEVQNTSSSSHGKSLQTFQNGHRLRCHSIISRRNRNPKAAVVIAHVINYHSSLSTTHTAPHYHFINPSFIYNQTVFNNQSIKSFLSQNDWEEFGGREGGEEKNLEAHTHGESDCSFNWCNLA